MKRIGILGTGGIANIHLDGWKMLPVTLAAHYDLRPEAAQRAASLYGGRACASEEEETGRVAEIEAGGDFLVHMIIDMIVYTVGLHATECGVDAGAEVATVTNGAGAAVSTGCNTCC